MNWKSVFILILFISSVCLWHSRFEAVDLEASGLPPVQNINSGLRYSTIQAAINAPQTLNGHTILVEEGIYNEHVTVNKSISLVGMNRNDTIIDGNGTGDAVTVSSDNVTVDDFTLRNGIHGIYVSNSNNFVILQCNVSYNGDGIHIRYSKNFTVDSSIVGNNTNRGLFVTNSLKFTVSNNHVYGSKLSYGLNVNASANGIITLNNVHENFFDGIGLGWNSTNCTVSGNSVYNNPDRGVWIDNRAENNTIYHNNLIGNGRQAIGSLFNHWNNSVEGNYWSNYTGVDLNHDGIGDTPHVIDANNTDYHPLMGCFSSFTAFTGYRVNIISNSTINEFKFLKSTSKNTIELKVSNTTATQKVGFCRVRILYALMKPTELYNVTVDGVTPSSNNYTLYDDGDSRWIYFAYNQSTNTVLIEGAAQLDTTPPIVLINSPLNTTYPASAIPLTFTVNEPTSWIGYNLDYQTNTTISGNITLPVLSEGSHSIIVYANDTSGNMGNSNTISFTVDTSPPDVVILSPENKTYTTILVTLNFTVDESTFWIGYSLDGSVNETIAGNMTFILTDGSHHVTVYAEDLVGNIGASQTVYFSVNTKSQQSWIEAFLMWIVVALTVTAVGLVVLAYFLKFRKKSKSQK
jgi:parallel beta-helix repeat protein